MEVLSLCVLSNCHGFRKTCNYIHCALKGREPEIRKWVGPGYEAKPESLRARYIRVQVLSNQRGLINPQMNKPEMTRN